MRLLSTILLFCLLSVVSSFFTSNSSGFALAGLPRSAGIHAAKRESLRCQPETSMKMVRREHNKIGFDVKTNVATALISASLLMGVLSSGSNAALADENSVVGDSSQVVAPVVVTPFGGGFGGMGFSPFGFNPFGGFGFGFGIRSTPSPPPPAEQLERSRAMLEANKARQAQLEQNIKVLEQQGRQQQRSSGGEEQATKK